MAGCVRSTKPLRSEVLPQAGVYCRGVTLTLRPAAAADQEYARRVHHLAYREVVERQFGEWDEPQQDGYFERGWPGHDHEIVEWHGERCGYAAIEFGAARADIHELVLHPDYQDQGIGTAILRQTVLHARELDLIVYLQVLRENRAAGLYERLGFEEYDNTATHRLMRLQSE